MKYRLEEVGRTKFSGIIEVKKLEDLPDQIKKIARLASSEVAVVWEDENETTGTVIVGGYRPVGKVFAIDSMTIGL